MSTTKEDSDENYAQIAHAMWKPPVLEPILIRKETSEVEKPSKKYRNSSPPKTPIRGLSGEEEEG